MEPLTLFTWGYWGWGTATGQLIQAVDAVEVSRGYQPPLFVDIRFSRNVRAPGFNGRAFQETVGASRYQWIQDLGNEAVQDGGDLVRIKNPAAADSLLDVAQSCASKRQRVLFFCSCEFPGVEDRNGCHRVTVARLVLEAARRDNVTTQVVEWPGGEPRPESLEIQLSAKEFEKVRRGSRSVPLTEPISLAEYAGLPWYSLVTVRRSGEDSGLRVLLMTGPARYKKKNWYLPVYERIDRDWTAQDVRQRIQKLREERGFVAALANRCRP